MCDVRPPERATRLTILRKRVAQDDVGEVDPAALELIADRVDANIRALEGALIRVVAFGSLTGRPVTAELADEVLAGLYPELKAHARAPCARSRSRPARPSASRWTTCCPRSRAQPVAFARQVAMYLARELTDATLPAIGRAFGNRNHTTVMHACKRTAGADGGRPRGLRGCAQAHPRARRRLMRSGPPDRLRQFIHRPFAALQRASRGLCTQLNNPDDH